MTREAAIMRREVSHPPGLQFAKFLPLQTGQSCAAAFLTKPVQEDQLIAAVEQLLGTEATRPLVPVA